MPGALEQMALVCRLKCSYSEVMAYKALTYTSLIFSLLLSEQYLE